jgi:AraC-like DNA-binding protein
MRGTRAVIAQYEADIGDPACTRAGTLLAGERGPLPRFLPVRDILRINFNMHGIVPADAVPRRMARSPRIPTDDNLALALPYAPTLRAALDLVARYGDAVVPWYWRRIVATGGELIVSYGPRVPLGRIESLSTEIALATIHRIVETWVGDRVADARVNFARPPVSSPTILAERFSCPVSVGGDESFMAFPAGWGARTSPYADRQLWLEGLARCEADIATLRDMTWAARVREHVLASLDAGRPPSLPASARALAMSSRSLVRALAAEGRTHHRIVDDERRRRAELLLAKPGVSIGEAAERLGFADQSSFGRKCRGWFGEGPSAVRQRLVRQGAEGSGVGAECPIAGPDRPSSGRTVRP